MIEGGAGRVHARSRMDRRAKYMVVNDSIGRWQAAASRNASAGRGFATPLTIRLMCAWEMPTRPASCACVSPLRAM